MNILSTDEAIAFKLVYFVDALINGKRFPPGCLTTLALVSYSFEQTNYAENVQIERHLAKCSLCREFLRYFHFDQGNHTTVHQLVDYVIGEHCWNPMPAKSRQIIDHHLNPPEEYLSCNRCQRIIDNLKNLPTADLFRLRNDDPIVWEQYRPLFDNFNRHGSVPEELLIGFVAGIAETDFTLR